MDLPPSSTMRRDVISAYGVTGARLGSWAVISAIVFRVMGAEAFGMLALIRATIGIFNYTSLGLAPAMIRFLSLAPLDNEQTNLSRGNAVLNYARPRQHQRYSFQSVYTNGLLLSGAAATLGAVVLFGYCSNLDSIYKISASARNHEIGLLALTMGIGVILRLASDTWGAVLQVQNRIFTDNLLLIASELVWIVIFATSLNGGAKLVSVGVGYSEASLFLLVARFMLTGAATGKVFPKLGLVDGVVLRALLSFGALVTVAQLADYLYAPVDFILINRLIDPAAVSAYAPAVQIDTGLHLVVIGLASVLLPKAAVAHAAGDLAKVRTYYLRGTLASVAITLPAALLVWALSPWIFKLWLGDTMPATQAILPLVLLHNLIGGSGTVGRSVLLAIGRVGPYSVSVLAAGVANVILSFVFVKYCGLGLYGIVLGTLCAVIGRALLWQPWYVIRTIRRAAPDAKPMEPIVAEAVAQVELRDAP